MSCTDSAPSSWLPQLQRHTVNHLSDWKKMFLTFFEEQLQSRTSPSSDDLTSDVSSHLFLKLDLAFTVFKNGFILWIFSHLNFLFYVGFSLIFSKTTQRYFYKADVADQTPAASSSGTSAGRKTPRFCWARQFQGRVCFANDIVFVWSVLKWHDGTGSISLHSRARPLPSTHTLSFTLLIIMDRKKRWVLITPDWVCGTFEADTFVLPPTQTHILE